MSQTLFAAAAIGLLGSAHCLGMCGGFVALLGVGGARQEVALRQGAYFAGKTATYAVFGALAGVAGALVGEVLGAFGGVLALALGLAMVGVGLGLCGVGAGRVPGARLAAVFAPVLGRLVGSGSPVALFGLGALNGLLPCGLVYGMLAVAAGTGSAVAGAATMAVFGLATLPALSLTGVLSARLRPRSRVWMLRLAGVVVVGMGLLTVTRGAQALSPAPGPTHTDLVCALGG